jgi:pSer/pThr/pTyr-binding forkhead associated (FHA) protein
MVAELLWQEGAGLPPPTDSFPDTEPLGLRLRLRYRGRQELFLDVHRPTLSLGRGQGNDLVIRDAQASRTHAQIEFRHSCFVLMDQSSNGTYVATEESGSLLVKRDEIVLRGRGRLSFGHPWTEGQAEFIDYLLLD